MAIESRTTQVAPSVLDRLFDDNPREPLEATSYRGASLQGFKRAVARDLEALLNSRCVDLDEEIEAHPQARNSMLAFGIIDLSSLSLLDPDDRAYLRDKIRITLERHETRLGKIRVTLEAPEGNERMLRFRVDALLKVHPTKPPVSFDATLQLSSSSYQIQEK